MRKKFEISATIYDKRGKVISKGFNSYRKTHPLQAEIAKSVGRPEAIFMHAEINALVKLKDWSKAHKIVVERYDIFGKAVLAKPCEICQEALKRAGIEIIEHT